MRGNLGRFDFPALAKIRHHGICADAAGVAETADVVPGMKNML